MDYLTIIFVAYVSYKIYDYITYPNKFRGKCGYCRKKHGRNEWHPNILNKGYCYQNGFVFLSKKCYNSWSKKNIICSNCHRVRKYSDSLPSHKFKRNYYYFCSSNCKHTFKTKNPKLFYEGYQRQSIPSEIRKIVFKRDGGKCVKCGSDKDIEYDHIIPVSKGGSDTINNIELLCEICNRSKSDKIE